MELDLQTLIPATNKSLDKPTNSSKNLATAQRLTEIRCRFKDVPTLLARANVNTQTWFASREELAVTEDFPTLAELNAAFGRNTSAAWLAVQLADLSIYTGAKNLSKRQQDQLAEIITTEFYWLKVSELLLFFHRFKTGSYGTFFGAVDPMVVTRALREFILERNDIIAEVEAREKTEREREERRLNPPITREEWERIKAEEAQAAEKPV